MNFWILLFLCLLTLAGQSAVIMAAALRSLRGEVELRWSAYIGLQKLLLRQLDDAGGAAVERFDLLICDTAKGFEDSLVTLSVQRAAAELASSQAKWIDCLMQNAVVKGISPQAAALPLRILHARQAYDAAVDAYEMRRLSPTASLLARWLGLGPVYRLERALNGGCDSAVGTRTDGG